MPGSSLSYRLAAACLLIVLFVAAAAAGAEGSPMGTILPSRPDPEGTPTHVKVAVFVIDVVSIDDREQEYTADVFVRVEWRDGRLAGPIYLLQR